MKKPSIPEMVYKIANEMEAISLHLEAISECIMNFAGNDKIHKIYSADEKVININFEAYKEE
jgi:hypothetical protein